MDKRTASKVLQRLAFAHEMVGSPDKAKRYAGVAWPIGSLEGDLRALYDSGALKGRYRFGKDILRILEWVLRGEEPPELAALEAQIPPGVLQMARIRGIGPKKVRQLWKDLEIETLGELEYACQENRLLDLKGFGAKTQAKVVEGLRQLRSYEGFYRRDQARAVLAALDALLTAPHLAVGEWRRGCELVRAVEIVLVGDEPVPADVVGIPVVVHRCAAADFGTEVVRHTATPSYLSRLQSRGALPDAATESEVFSALGLACPPPECMEDHSPLYTDAVPRLVRRGDLRGALHNHTTASDGRNSLAEMKAAAAARGLDYLGISEHSQSAQYAHGLSAAQLMSQVRAIEALNAQGGCQLVTGIESDIRRDGTLDYEAEVLARVDIVIASVHARFGQTGEALTDRMVRAAHDPDTCVIGHPTGRLLLGRPPSEFDMEELLDACAESGCAVELNASPHRLDLSVPHLRMAKDRGLRVSIAPDAHSVDALDNLDYGIATARRAGLSPSDVLNCRSLDEVRDWATSHRSR